MMIIEDINIGKKLVVNFFNEEENKKNDKLFKKKDSLIEK